MEVDIYAVGLCLTMLQIYLYQYWNVAKVHKGEISAPQPCTVYLCQPNYQKIISEALIMNFLL